MGSLDLRKSRKTKVFDIVKVSIIVLTVDYAPVANLIASVLELRFGYNKSVVDSLL